VIGTAMAADFCRTSHPQLALCGSQNLNTLVGNSRRESPILHLDSRLRNRRVIHRRRTGPGESAIRFNRAVSTKKARPHKIVRASFLFGLTRRLTPTARLKECPD